MQDAELLHLKAEQQLDPLKEFINLDANGRRDASAAQRDEGHGQRVIGQRRAPPVLLFEGPWRIEAGISFNFFLWDPDGTLCVKLFDPQADTSDDTGTWFRNETIVCYWLRWWGKTDNQRQGCFQILETKPGIYETLDAGGFPGLKFTVMQTI